MIKFSPFSKIGENLIFHIFLILLHRLTKVGKVLGGTFSFLCCSEASLKQTSLMSHGAILSWMLP
jgi:hypothetical protein